MTVFARWNTIASIALAAAVLSLFPGPAGAETAAEYRARLDRWAGGLAQAQRRLARSDPAWRSPIQEISAQAADDRYVTRSAGEPVSVDHQWLARHIDDALRAPDRRHAAAALRAASDQLDAHRGALGVGPAHDPARVRAVLARVLPSGASPRRVSLEWLRRIVERMLAWLEGLFSSLPDLPGGTSGVLAWVVLGIAAAILVGTLFLAGRALLRRFAPSAGGVEPSLESGLRAAPPPDPDSLLEQSRRAAGAGDHREAIRLLYLAVIWRLHLAGLIQYHPAATNWEYLRSLRDAAPRPSLESLTMIFDRTCYGGARAVERDYEECERLFGRVVAGVGTP